jgi:hypothetical protein
MQGNVGQGGRQGKARKARQGKERHGNRIKDGKDMGRKGKARLGKVR